MGRIILTVPGPWVQPPDLDAPLTLEFHDRDHDLVADIEAITRRTESLDADELASVRKHRGVVVGRAEVSKPGDIEPARAAMRFLLDAFDAGAAAALIDTGLKVIGRHALRRGDLRDRQMLFHTFVEVLVESDRATTEGMQAFALPDVVARYDDASGRGPAQAAAFALAAQMVCDRTSPQRGALFQASLSAPHYAIGFEAGTEAGADATADDPFVNAHGAWVLTPRRIPSRTAD